MRGPYMYLDALLHGLEVVLQVTILRLRPTTHNNHQREGGLASIRKSIQGKRPDDDRHFECIENPSMLYTYVDWLMYHKVSIENDTL